MPEPDQFVLFSSVTPDRQARAGLLLTGVSGGEFGVVGRVEARDPRTGDNLFSCSTVALDVETGQIKWSYQTTLNDGWDFDGVSEFVTFDMDGKRFGGKADRNGFFYVINAKNGKLQNAFPFVRKITWASSIDLKTGRPNYIADNRPGDPTKGEDGKKGKSVLAVPSFLGGKNQMPMAYNPQTKLFYVPANEWAMEIWPEGFLKAVYAKSGAELWKFQTGPIQRREERTMPPTISTKAAAW